MAERPTEALRQMAADHGWVLDDVADELDAEIAHHLATLREAGEQIAALTAEVGRLREFAIAVRGINRTVYNKAAKRDDLNPTTEPPRQKRECPGRGGSCDWVVDLNDPGNGVYCCACGRKKGEPVPTDEEFAQRFNLSAKERVLRGLPADQPAPEDER